MSSFAIGGFKVTVLVQTKTSVIKFEPIKFIYYIKLLLTSLTLLMIVPA